MGKKETSQDKVPFDRTRARRRATLPKKNGKLTRLEDEGASDIHIPTIARWFDTLIGAQQRADDERSGLANAIE
jgi:hypothetical protein